jgi:mono/diheme cytochrome c family protein
MIKYLFLLIFIAFLLSSCTDSEKEIGTGPVKKVELGEINNELVRKGELLFNSKCLSCHNNDARGLAPDLTGVTGKRKPEWIMNMILNPEGMLEKDKQAKELSGQYKMPMYKQIEKEDEARALLEYLRTKN